MFRYIKAVVLLFVCLAFVDIYASEQIIDLASKRTKINKSNIGVSVYDINDKKIIYSLNGDKQYGIASVNKMFVTAAALKYLGQDYRFKTTIYGRQPDRSGVVSGDIYIKGGGDPFFVSESMWFLVNSLVDIGVKSIEGNIILDDTSFPPADVYEEGGGDRAYSAKLSSLSVNFNSIAISTTSGSNAYISLDPQVPNLQLVDKTRSSSKKTDIEIRRDGSKIVVSGNVNDAIYSNKIVYRNIDDPSRYFAEVLKLHLKWRGLEYKGTMKRGRADTGENKLFDIESRRLTEILAEMNKYSTNYVAEQVIRAISDKELGDASDTDGAVKLIKDYLIGMGVDRSGFEIVNGSGFSRMNRIKPDEMMKFLENVYRDFSISPEFINSLSIAGVDGTIRKTHRSDFMTRKLRAKTGTLSGIRSLAGYINYKEKIYAFMIVANDSNAYSLVDWEGKILESIIKGTEGN